MNILQSQAHLQMCVDVEGNAMIWTKRASTHEATHKTDCKHTSLVLIAESVPIIPFRSLPKAVLYVCNLSL